MAEETTILGSQDRIDEDLRQMLVAHEFSFFTALVENIAQKLRLERKSWQVGSRARVCD